MQTTLTSLVDKLEMHLYVHLQTQYVLPFENADKEPSAFPLIACCTLTSKIIFQMYGMRKPHTSSRVLSLKFPTTVSLKEKLGTYTMLEIQYNIKIMDKNPRQGPENLYFGETLDLLN